MSKKGGYQILDFGGVDIDPSTGANIPGIYDRVEGLRLDKPVLVSGVVVDGEGVFDCFASPVADSDGIYYIPLNTLPVEATTENAGTPAALTMSALKIESDDDLSVITVTITSAS